MTLAVTPFVLTIAHTERGRYLRSEWTFTVHVAMAARPHAPEVRCKLVRVCRWARSKTKTAPKTKSKAKASVKAKVTRPKQLKFELTPAEHPHNALVPRSVRDRVSALAIAMVVKQLPKQQYPSGGTYANTVDYNYCINPR